MCSVLLYSKNGKKLMKWEVLEQTTTYSCSAISYLIQICMEIKHLVSCMRDILLVLNYLLNSIKNDFVKHGNNNKKVMTYYNC